jgi:hypothetical protein
MGAMGLQRPSGDPVTASLKNQRLPDRPIAREIAPMSKGPWFRRRTFGYGWTPITWEGWLVTLGLCIALVAINLAVVAFVISVRR